MFLQDLASSTFHVVEDEGAQDQTKQDQGAQDQTKQDEGTQDQTEHVDASQSSSRGVKRTVDQLDEQSQIMMTICTIWTCFMMTIWTCSFYL